MKTASRKKPGSLMGDGAAGLLRMPANRAASILAQRFADDALDASVRMAAAKDATALHDFRVAVRRLRSTLRAFRDDMQGAGLRRIRKQLSEIAEATGISRDLEVQLEFLSAQRTRNRLHKSGFAWMRKQLVERKRDYDVHSLTRVLTVFPEIHAALSGALATISGKLARSSFARVLGAHIASEADALSNGLQSVRSISQQERAHAARITGKRLRYLVEPVMGAIDNGPAIVNRLKRLQDMIGSMHDHHILLAQTRDLLAAPPPGSVHSIAFIAGLPEVPAPIAGPLVPDAARPGLEELARRLDAACSRDYRRLRSSWSGATRQRFFAAVQRAAQQLSDPYAAGAADLEIERKYLLRGIPRHVAGLQAARIDQGYLPGVKLAERIRRVRMGRSTRYYRTVKLGRGITRTEIEEKATRVVFEAMWPLTEGKRVSKLRYAVREQDHVWEIDVFLDRKLVLAEIELKNSTDEPVIPRWLKSWLVREVTDDSTYVNINLAK